MVSLHHLAIIASSEETVKFYTRLGFHEISRQDRGYDVLVYLDGPCVLEIYIDATHPPRVDRPEAMGLRHFALQVDNLEQFLKDARIDAESIRENNGQRYTFIRDPDGLPIEIREQPF